MNVKKINVGDLVIVSGSTVTHGGKVQHHNVMAKVLGVGQWDVFLEKTNKYARSTIFRTPISRCATVREENISLDSSITQPELGDLVMSLTESLGKVEKVVGVLMEIIDIPAEKKLATIQVGSDDKTVSFESLIVLSRKK